MPALTFLNAYPVHDVGSRGMWLAFTRERERKRTHRLHTCNTTYVHRAPGNYVAYEPYESTSDDFGVFLHFERIRREFVNSFEWSFCSLEVPHNGSASESKDQQFQ